MAALEAKQKPSTLQNQELNHPDQVISERLARLRQENKPSEWNREGGLKDTIWGSWDWDSSGSYKVSPCQLQS